MADNAATQFPVMENMTVKQIREYLQRKQSIIIPLGVIEQHGYHLPLKTDALIAAGVARQIGKQADILVAPVIYTSFSGGGLPGTINISPAVMSQVVGDTLVSLVSQGFRNIYLFLCHGGSENARALDNAVALLLRMNPAFQQVMIALIPEWKCCTSGQSWSVAFAEGDWHAGWIETSMVMALAPELVRMQDLAMDPEPYASLMIEHPDNYQHAEKIVDHEYVIPRMSQHPQIEVGVMGNPRKATPELGREVIADTVKHAVAIIEELEAKADGVYKEVAYTPEPLLLIAD